MSKIIKGDVNISRLALNSILEMLDFSDIIVEGSFDCSYNQLTSLEGSPKSVEGSFWCENNQLISLEGSPKTVGRHFYCNNNLKKFTEEEVRKVCDVRGELFV
jgi:hypothetical protein